MLDFSPSFGCRWETLGAVTASSRGTVLTGGTANTKGTAVSIGTPTFGYNQLVVSLHNSSAAADYIVDVCVGNPSTTGWILCPDLRFPAKPAINFGGISYVLPIAVGTSTALFARCASSTASATCAIALHGGSSGLFGVPGFSRLVSLYTPASSKGASFTTSATANTDSAWTSLSTGVTQRVGGVLLVVGGPATAASSNYLLRIGAGASGSQRAILGPVGMQSITGTGDAISPFLHGPDPCDIPASTAFWVAGQADGASRVLDVALHGLVV